MGFCKGNRKKKKEKRKKKKKNPRRSGCLTTSDLVTNPGFNVDKVYRAVLMSFANESQ